MAHLISSVIVNGLNIVEAMYANRPAWHGLGAIFARDGHEAPDSERAMELAHLNWLISLEAMYVKNVDGSHSEAPGFLATVRNDNRNVLGVVSDRYRTFQNAEAFKFLDSLQMDGIIRYESAFALKGGCQVCLLARMPSVDHVTDEDASLRYVLASTTHDGTGAIDLLPTSVRTVCANTVRLALQKDGGKHRVSIRHTGDLSAKLASAREYLSQFDAQFSLFRDEARKLATYRYSSEQAKQYMATLFPLPTDATDRQKANVAARLAAVRDAFAHPSNQLPTVKGTFWQLFNAVTFALDHGGVRTRASNERMRAENKFVNLMDGPAADLKARAFLLALEMAA